MQDNMVNFVIVGYRRMVRPPKKLYKHVGVFQYRSSSYLSLRTIRVGFGKEVDNKSDLDHITLDNRHQHKG